MSGSPSGLETELSTPAGDERAGSADQDAGRGLAHAAPSLGGGTQEGRGRQDPRSQTVATWLALLGGALGFHRFYLYGFGDTLGWLLWLPTLLGGYGVSRMRDLGQDDRIAWVLIPALGLVLTATALTSIRYGLMTRERWNARFDPAGTAPSLRWLDILGAVTALALGATVLIASIAFMSQRYFESRVPEVAAHPAAMRDPMPSPGALHARLGTGVA